MTRITEQDLNQVVNVLNNIASIKEGAKWNTVGAFCISHAYGGVCLERVESEHGAVSDVFRCGHVTRKDLYNRVYAFIEGIRFTQDLNSK